MIVFKRLLVALILSATITTTGMSAVQAPVPIPTVTVVEVKKLTVDEAIVKYSDLYNVNLQLMRSVINCESSFNPNAIGDNGHSRGLVQIYDDYHPTISHEQAFDIEFSVEFLAKNISRGRGYLWTCFRNINKAP